MIMELSAATSLEYFFESFGVTTWKCSSLGGQATLWTFLYGLSWYLLTQLGGWSQHQEELCNMCWHFTIRRHLTDHRKKETDMSRTTVDWYVTRMARSTSVGSYTLAWLRTFWEKCLGEMLPLFSTDMTDYDIWESGCHDIWEKLHFTGKLGADQDVRHDMTFQKSDIWLEN